MELRFRLPWEYERNDTVRVDRETAYASWKE
jgi:hypothetical protein